LTLPRWREARTGHTAPGPHLDVEGRLPFEGIDRLGRVDVEHSEDDLTVGTARDGVPGEQHTRFGKIQRDAARGVAGHRHGLCPTAEVEHVTVVELVVDAHRRWRAGRQLSADLVEQVPLPVGEVR
jgi:hypothetical protein